MGSLSVWHWIIVAVIVGLTFVSLRRPRAAAPTTLDDLGQTWSLAVPRGDQDTYSKAERLRDDIANRFRNAKGDSDLALTCYDSVRGSGAVWLRLEFVKAEPARPELSLRTVIMITVERRDFHRFEHLIQLEVGRGLLRRRRVGLVELLDADIRSLVAFARGERAVFPRLASLQLREKSWQIWRPYNRIERLRPDWTGRAFMAAAGVAVLYGAAQLIVQSDYTEESCEVSGQCPDATTGVAAILLGIALLVVRFAIVRRRLTLVLNSGKPSADPLSLVRMDAWQSTLSGIGARRDAVQGAVVQRLEQSKPGGVAMRAEWIGYASVDGKVEREQWVISFRRAIAFVRLEAYGNDLYVGWDSHVNAGTWREEEIARGLDKVSGRPVVARHVVQGWQQPTEYDVTDASFLTEWLHAAIVSVVKRELAEYQIDQEIDFTIQRESRAAALRSGPDEKKPPNRFGLLRRKG